MYPGGSGSGNHRGLGGTPGGRRGAPRHSAFPRSCLELIGKGRRTDGQLSICAPSDNPLCIPFFFLVYLLESEEYLRFSGEKEYIRAYFPKFESILQVFADRLDETGLIPSSAENRLYWNFYEWAPTLEGVCGGPEPAKTDLVLNAAYALALEAMAKMSRALDKPEEALRYLERKEKCCRAIHRGFWSEEAGLYRTVAGREAYSETANAFAVLCGAATGERAEAVCERIAGNRGELVPATLSMRGFKYDALLSVDPAKYRDFILGEIDRDYGSMLEAGATSFWETMEGEAAFHRAGSLCHGWSAIPIIYHHLLLP